MTLSYSGVKAGHLPHVKRAQFCIALEVIVALWLLTKIRLLIIYM
jgi:hypothetical protein